MGSQASRPGGSAAHALPPPGSNQSLGALLASFFLTLSVSLFILAIIAVCSLIGLCLLVYHVLVKPLAWLLSCLFVSTALEAAGPSVEGESEASTDAGFSKRESVAGLWPYLLLAALYLGLFMIVPGSIFKSNASSAARTTSSSRAAPSSSPSSAGSASSSSPASSSPRNHSQSGSIILGFFKPVVSVSKVTQGIVGESVLFKIKITTSAFSSYFKPKAALECISTSVTGPCTVIPAVAVGSIDATSYDSRSPPSPEQLAADACTVVLDVKFTPTRIGNYVVHIRSSYPFFMSNSDFSIRVTPGPLFAKRCDLRSEHIQSKVPVRSDASGSLNITVVLKDKSGALITDVSAVSPDKFTLKVDDLFVNVFASFRRPGEVLVQFNPFHYFSAVLAHSQSASSMASSSSSASSSTLSSASSSASAPALAAEAMSLRGLKQCMLFYDGDAISDNPFEVLFLSEQETAEMDKHLLEPKVFFQVSMRVAGAPLEQLWMRITPETVGLLHYYLKIFSKAFYKAKLHPNFKVDVCSNDPRKFILGSRKIEIFTHQRNVIVALLLRYANRRRASPGNFSEARSSFEEKLRAHYARDNNQDEYITVNRAEITKSAMAAFARLSVDARRLVKHIRFQGEPAVDAGGPRREFYTVLCKELFGESLGLFAKLDPSSSCVHPVPSKKSSSHLRAYRFAGFVLGKVIYDSYVKRAPMNVNVRLSQSTRKYLVQMACAVEDFEVDDPEFFKSKVQYVQSTNMDTDAAEQGVELFFSEEEYDEERRPKTSELKPGGAKIKVTEANKQDYLQLLAEHRLVSVVKDALKEFSEGFYEVLPDELVCMFDFKELELLVCGIPEINVQDLKAHAMLEGANSETATWFWGAVENFSQEQLARLLQFATGSSQVPTTGFGSYSPRLKFVFTGGDGSRLPTASTCANLMRIPHYTSFEQLQEKIIQAISEGAEGFGFS